MKTVCKIKLVFEGTLTLGEIEQVKEGIAKFYDLVKTVNKSNGPAILPPELKVFWESQLCDMLSKPLNV